MKKIIRCSNSGDRLAQQRLERATSRVCTSIRSLYSVMQEYEGIIDQILNDPNYYEETIEELRYLESKLRY